MSGNRGEWSELYVFLRLLAEGRVYAADEKVERIDTIFYPILHIVREEIKDRKLFYVIGDEDVSVTDGHDTLMTVSRKVMGARADELLNGIQNGSGTFELSNTAEFANGIRVTKIKAPSRDKTDIQMRIEDRYVNSVQDVGFSVKSELGNSPTLLNASPATNFIYAVDGLETCDIEAINNINDKNNKIVKRCSAILNRGGKLRFVGMDNDTFRGNLELIDSRMPEIVAAMLEYHYTENVKTCSELVSMLEERNPMGFGRPLMYDFKIKRLLSAVALGMRPADEWDGRDEANGGYVIVRVDGEILVYHIYNRNAFEQYLLSNTVLERGSTHRHKYMHLYEENGEIRLKLNLQIRF